MKRWLELIAAVHLHSLGFQHCHDETQRGCTIWTVVGDLVEFIQGMHQKFLGLHTHSQNSKWSPSSPLPPLSSPSPVSDHFSACVNSFKAFHVLRRGT